MIGGALTDTRFSRRDEQEDYFSRTAAWADVHPSQMVGPPVSVKSYDLLKLSLEELKADLKVGPRRAEICK